MFAPLSEEERAAEETGITMARAEAAWQRQIETEEESVAERSRMGYGRILLLVITAFGMAMLALEWIARYV